MNIKVAGCGWLVAGLCALPLATIKLRGKILPLFYPYILAKLDNQYDESCLFKKNLEKCFMLVQLSLSDGSTRNNAMGRNLEMFQFNI